jgi:serine/threonine protein kinase/Tfp pilus assembly protein PilF
MRQEGERPEASTWSRAGRIFKAASEKPATERASFLEAACGGDDEIRLLVNGMLGAFEEARDAFTPPAGGDEAQDSGPAGARQLEASELLGTKVGPYKVLQLIGEGGFGTVYMAEQDAPVERRVALKVIKLGMDTKQVIARFEAERQALALMNHPHIAKVLDAGSTRDGRPYFVMELVQGVPITAYCDSKNLSTRERLGIFTSVCQAVQHAHQKGIIHRDLKPSNILVALEDGKPAAKVIDFGVAKAVDRRLTEKTLFTELGQVIGTPVYMSPEQAEMSGLDIDTRSDIYSLGVLLYELLTGTTPFDAGALRKAAYAELQRIIREVEPPKPSTRLSTLGAKLANVARHRDTEPRSLSRELRGDLDWIVMKCLEKDPTRRYDTASSLALDLGRHFAHEPVAAGPPSAAYKLRKFARRNKGWLAAAGLVAAALVVGLAAATYGLVEARRQRDSALEAKEAETRERRRAEIAQAAAEAAETTADAARAAAEEQKTLAEASALRANEEAAKAEEVSEFLREMLAAVDPETAQGRDVTVREVLDESARKIEGGDLAAQSEVEGAVRMTIGDSYLALGLYGAAEPHFRAALEIRRRLHGPKHGDVAASLSALAVVASEQGDNAAAEALAREALETDREVFGPSSSEVANGLNNLAELLRSRGRFAEAEGLFREALDIRRKVFGEEHNAVAESLNNLATLLGVKGDFPGAESFYRQALAMQKKLRGERHPRVAYVLGNLGQHLELQGRHDEAEPLLRECAAILKETLGDDHPRVASATSMLARLFLAKGDPTAAEPLFREVLAARRKRLGDEHPRVAETLNDLGELLYSTGDYAGAEPHLREALAVQQKRLGADHPELGQTMNNLAAVLQGRREFGGAEPLFREALALRRKHLGDEHPVVATSLANLAVCLQLKGDLAGAEQLFREALALNRKLRGERDPTIALNLSGLADLLLRKGDPAAAEPLLRESLAILAETLPEHRRRFDAMSLLGAALANQAKYAEAEPLLLESYAGLKRLPRIPQKPVRNALGRLIKLYEAWGKPDEAAKWRALLEEP